MMPVCTYDNAFPDLRTLQNICEGSSSLGIEHGHDHLDYEEWIRL